MITTNFYNNNLVLYIFFVIQLVIFFFVLFSLINKKVSLFEFHFWFILFALLLPFVGYYTLPYVTDDLYRYYQTIDYFSINEINEILTYGFSSTPLANLLLFFISKLNNPPLLPYIVILLEILFIFFILKLSFNLFKITYLSLTIYLLSIVAILSFYVSVSGIRYNLSITLLGFIITLYFSKKINWTLFVVFSILGILIHSYSIVFLIYAIVSKISFLKKRLLLFTLILFLLLYFAFRLELSEFSYLSIFLERILVYFGSNLISSSILRNLGYFLVFIFFFSISHNRFKNPKVKLHSNFIKFLVYFSGFSYFIFPEVFFRSLSIMAIMAFPLYLELLENFKITFHNKIDYRFLIFFSGLVILLFFEFINYYRDWIFIV